MRTWIFQRELGEDWLQKSIVTRNIRCINASVIMRSSDEKYGLGYNFWHLKFNQKPEGFAFEVGWWLSALCRYLNNFSASFYCIYFFNIVRHHINFIFSIQNGQYQVFFFLWSFAKMCGSLSAVWLFWEAFHIEMHVHTSNLKICGVPQHSLVLSFGESKGNLEHLRVPPIVLMLMRYQWMKLVAMLVSSA